MMKIITILGYEIKIIARKIVPSRRIVCENCGQMVLVWGDIDVCEHCHEIQLAADIAENLMEGQMEKAQRVKG
jgi:hypothetical protein